VLRRAVRTGPRRLHEADSHPGGGRNPGGAPWRGAGIAARVGDDHRIPGVNVYAQTISLETVALTAGQQLFSERQTIVGGNVIYPLSNVAAIGDLRPSLIGAVNGRFLNVQSDALALSQSPSFIQFEEGIRIKPAVFAIACT